ncbi:MAG: proline/glycine betaine ABC transporter permease [Chloroflexi bacterium]|nr:proline/glycine betaine ABC transporter permease [Chloroflexota bacterium]
MDLLRSIDKARSLDPREVLSSWGWKAALAVVVLLVGGDLVIEYLRGPTRDFFFPRLYTWVFIGLGGWLVWISLKSLGHWKWRLLLGGVIAAVVVLTIRVAPSEFPNLAPGQEYENVTTNRTTLVKPISLNVLGLEIRPHALGKRIDAVVAWMVGQWRGFFRGMTENLLKALTPLERLLLQAPWWLLIGLVGLLAWRVSGYRVALLSVLSLVMIGVFGLWGQTMRTLAVVGTATLMSVAVAIPVGIAMSKSDRLQGVIRPVLDAMQTMPSFVYLIPAIYFLGLGKVPAVLATMVYAMPPAMRMTNLGIRLVSQELVEAARAFGTTPWQLLIKIQLPLARPTIMAGVNQTIMMALAMVIVASMVGARGLGYDILSGIQNLEFGTGLMAGIAIVVLAVVIDRIAQGFARDPRNQSGS